MSHKVLASTKLARRDVDILIGDNSIDPFLIPDYSGSGIFARLVATYSIGNLV